MSEAEKLVASVATGVIEMDGQRCYYATLEPALCQKLLDLTNKDNPRPVSQKRVMAFVREMEANRLRRTHQGIAFTRDNMMADGQHRLWAATIANYTLRAQVTFGLQREDVEAVDAGDKRQLHHRLAFAKGADFTARHAAICKTLIGGTVRNPDVWPFYETVADSIDFAVGLGQKNPGHRRLSGAPIFAAFARAHICGKDPAQLTECHRAWVTGDGWMSMPLRKVRDSFVEGEYLGTGSKSVRRKICIVVQHWIQMWLQRDKSRKQFRAGDDHIYKIAQDDGHAAEDQ